MHNMNDDTVSGETNLRIGQNRNGAKSSRDAQMIAVARYIEQNSDEKLTLKHLSERVNLSEAHFQKLFKSVFGCSPKAYQDAARLATFKSLLKNGDGVSGAVYEAGYGSTSRVYEKALKNVGMTPSSYRAGGAGEEIYFRAKQISLGTLLMAATDRGVCFAMLGDSVDELMTQLRSEFPNAALKRSPTSSDEQLDRWMAGLDRYLSKEGPSPQVPLDMQGTAFQIKVWEFLLSVPDGATVSYSDVAKGVGKPKAIRAAATACGRNKIAVLVPCHRVLRGSGAVGGYRWGVERKRKLLELEAAVFKNIER